MYQDFDKYLWGQIITDVLDILHINYVAQVIYKPNFQWFLFFKSANLELVYVFTYLGLPTRSIFQPNVR